MVTRASQDMVLASRGRLGDDPAPRGQDSEAVEVEEGKTSPLDLEGAEPPLGKKGLQAAGGEMA